MSSKKKFFLITIDTEEDNQWEINKSPSTENVKYLPRFQELAEKYGYKPTWLTTYNMANDEEFVRYFKTKQDNNLCEIGMHLHAWNTPPEYYLEKLTDARPYLIEYPIEIMEKKIKTLDQLLVEKFKTKPISHRAGRWTTNDEYFNFLKKCGYKIDTSVTPGVNWNKCLGQTGIAGSNYTKKPNDTYKIKDTLLEVPLTIRRIHAFSFKNIKSFKNLLREMKSLLVGKYQWIRPDNSYLLDGIFKVMHKCSNDKEYIMFMIHSSELMPGR